MIDHTSGAVLVGGESRRMGTSKADLEHLGITFVDHAAATLSVVVSDVVVVGDTYRGPLPSLFDAVAGSGPLGGILAALRDASPKPVMVLAVDLPLVSVELVSRIVEPQVDAGSIRMATDGLQAQPLCAVWGSQLAESIASYLERGERSVLGFAESIRSVDSVQTDAHILTNINTPADYDQLWGGGTL